MLSSEARGKGDLRLRTFSRKVDAPVGSGESEKGFRDQEKNNNWERGGKKTLVGLKNYKRTDADSNDKWREH